MDLEKCNRERPGPGYTRQLDRDDLLALRPRSKTCGDIDNAALKRNWSMTESRLQRMVVCVGEQSRFTVMVAVLVIPMN